MSGPSHDVVVVGGGLVGASLAVALAPLGLRVAVIEAVAPGAPRQPSYDDRTLALNHASCRILQGIDLWADLARQATPIVSVTVSELDRPFQVELHAAEMDVDAFGHVVEARAFGEAVLAKLETLDNVEVIRPARLSALELREDSIRIELDAERGESLSAALLVGADGGRSTVRSLLGIPARHKDYEQTAVICNVTPRVPHAGRAFERMTATGPFALLPHTQGRCGLVWCVEHDRAPELLASSEADFLAAATRRSGGVLGELCRLGRRSSYPLHQVLAERDTAPRAVILGNAAHAIHPAGAQGFNLGLRDAAVLVELLHSARQEKRVDAGAAELLADYSAWRREDQRGTAAWSDGIVGLFADTTPLVSTLRSLGMLAHAALPPMRRRVAAQAMGYRGRVPRLALGEALS